MQTNKTIKPNTEPCPALRLCTLSNALSYTPKTVQAGLVTDRISHSLKIQAGQTNSQYP